MGSDDHVPLGYSPEPVDPEDFDPWDDPASDQGFGVLTTLMFVYMYYTLCIWYMYILYNICIV